MQTDKCLVSILLAVYKPNENWFIEQLISLNSQTYGNLELLIYDDCPEFPVDENLFKKYITNFSYTLIRGKKNQGSNKAFEELTKLGNGEYFAYCDQDDIWELNKISLMVEKFKDKDVTLVCCDLSIIDENSIKTHNSLRDIRKRIVYKSGYNLAKDLLMVNFVTGCAMMVKKEIVKKAVPFEDMLIHDQWIAIVAAIEGMIEFINKPLVRYRQHSFNQTGILTDIYDKETYYKMRIDAFLKRYKSLQKRLIYNEELSKHISYCLKWIEGRKGYSTKPSFKDLKIMIKYRKFHKISILIETFLPFIPNTIFKYIINMTKKGLL
ncbi:glycosyltransferase [Clostridium sp. ZBS18]|uniref:glycosyltransferase n=1 Tax=Clostridium sp. ZBS18 TaxID=2949967 RepID=UPI0020795918|nr:glycosyltransferase [Clostridium sp. ZBS18]